MKRISLYLLLLLVGCTSALRAATPTSTITETNTPTPTFTFTSTVTATFTATPSSTATPTITRTPTTVTSLTPISSLDGQKGRVVMWPKDVVLSDRVKQPLLTPASTPDDPYILDVNGHTGIAWDLSTSVAVINNIPVPGDYKSTPMLWGYASTTVSVGTSFTVNMKVDVQLARMGSAAPVSFFAGTSTNIASVIYPGSLNGSATGTGTVVRVQLPLPGGYAQSVTYSPYTTGVYVPGALKPGDTIAAKLSRLSTGPSLRFLRFDLEYQKNTGLNP